MADIAQLGFAVDTTGLAKGEVALKKLSNASAMAEKSALGVTVANDNVSAASDRAAASYMRLGNAAKMASFQQRNLVFQLNDVFVSLASGMNPLMVAAQQGSQLATIYGPGEGGIGRAFKETGKLITGVLTRFPLVTAAVAGITAAFGALTYEINRTGQVQVTFGDVALGVFQTIRDGIWSFIKPAVDAIAPWFAAAYDLVTGYTKTAVNMLVGGFVGAFYVIQDLWMSFPSIIGNAAVKAAQAIIDAITYAQRRAYELINPGQNGDLKIARPILSNPFSSGANFNPTASFARGFGLDYAGNLFGSVASNARNNALARQKPEKEKAENAKKVASEYLNMRDAIRAANDNLREAASVSSGFLQSMRDGLVEGKGLWSSFGAAASGALDRISDRLIEMATNQLISNIFGAVLGGSTGGYFGSSGYTNLLSFGGPRASGGPVSGNKAYLVGEKGPELFVPGASGNIVSNQNMAGMGGNVINIDARGAQAGVGEEIRKALEDYDRQSYARTVANVQQARKRRAI